MRSEKSEKLYQAITDLPDNIVEDAQKTRPRQPSYARRWIGGAIAAVLVIAIGFGGYGVWNFLNNNLGGSSTGGGGQGHNESSIFMSYGGPVFPLTLAANNDGISAERAVCPAFCWSANGGERHAG
jgi:hypothetical protein